MGRARLVSENDNSLDGAVITWVVEGWELGTVLSPVNWIDSIGSSDEASGGSILLLLGWGDAPVVNFGNLSGESSIDTGFASGTGPANQVAEPWRVGVACRLITCRCIESVILLHSLTMPCYASMQRCDAFSSICIAAE